MNDLQFAPVLPRHAIERCAASIAFTPSIPDKAFERLAQSAASSITAQGFTVAPTMAFGFQVTSDGQMTPLPQASAPRNFTSKEQSNTITMTPDGIVWTTVNYVRWPPFIGEFERFVLPLLAELLQTVSIAAVKLEYWDRFIWSGDWDNFDVQKLIRAESPFVVEAAVARTKQWHSHAGWFDKEGSLRRLTNINVDVSEIVSAPPIPARPSVGIYSALTDQGNVPGYGQVDLTKLDGSFVIERLESQHLALKDILGHIVSDDMANRISLFSRKTAHASR